MLKKFFLCTLFLTQCKSFTKLSVSNVEEAAVYIDGEYIGKTPCKYETTAPSFSQKSVCLKKEGYKDLNISLSRAEELDFGALVGSAGLFGIGLALPTQIGWAAIICSFVPDLFLMKYKPEHIYTMEKSSASN